MDKNEIQKKLFGMVEFARKRYKEGGSFMPMIEVVGIDEKGEVGGMVAILGDEGAQEKRFEILHNMGRSIALGTLPQNTKINPYAALFASEAWVSKYGKDVDVSKMPMPSKDPNKTEAFIVSASTIEGKDVFTTLEIKRGKDVELIGEMDFDKWEKGENRLLAEFWKGYHSIIKKA